MHRASTPVRVLALIAAVVLFVAAGGGALAVADDYLTREVLPPSASVAGVDVSGLTREAARELVLQEVAEPLGQPVTVTHENVTFTLAAADLITIDVDGMVDEAFKPRASSSLAYRVKDRVLATPANVDAPVRIAVDEAALGTWLDTVASQVETVSSDATVTVEPGKNTLTVVPSRRGVTLDRAATLDGLTRALAAGEKQVALAVTYTEPAVSEDDLGPAIVVDLSERRLYLYVNGKLEKKYGVAVGAPSFPTPRGSFKIVLKRYMPTWSNPGSAWAADMPKSIGPGPSNPLGTRALNLDAPGIRIHGTSKDYSIGTAASHGCMRMHRWDIEDLYERVEVGTPVFIVR